MAILLIRLGAGAKGQARKICRAAQLPFLVGLITFVILLLGSLYFNRALPSCGASPISVALFGLSHSWAGVA